MAIFERGARVGEMIVVRLLGSGRSAEVYEVIVPGGARRALKILKEAASLGAKASLRLGQEGDAVATIEHLSTVRWYDTGIEGGRAWILIELVDGPNLRELVRAEGGRLPVDRAVRIVKQVAEGLAAAHDLGILHRDVEPGNILVAADDVAKIADFGSSKPGDWGVRTTREPDLCSALYKDPDYMKREVAVPESDVYSLALVLYEIIAGAHPIAPEPASMFVICMRQLEHVPPPLASLSTDDRPIPGDLSFLLEEALAKEPSKRPTMRKLAERLALVEKNLNAQRRAAARSLPLANRDDRLALTLPAMPMFGLGKTLPMQAFSDPPASGTTGTTAGADSGRDAAPPPAPSGPRPCAPTMPLAAVVPPVAAPAPANDIVATREVEPPGERRSTAAPVEREASRPSMAQRALPPVLGVVGALAAAGLVGVGWLLGHGGGAAESRPPAPAAAAASVTAAPVGSSSAAPARATASAAPPRRRAAPAPAQPGQRPQLPFK